MPKKVRIWLFVVFLLLAGQDIIAIFLHHPWGVWRTVHTSVTITVGVTLLVYIVKLFRLIRAADREIGVPWQHSMNTIWLCFWRTNLNLAAIKTFLQKKNQEYRKKVEELHEENRREHLLKQMRRAEAQAEQEKRMGRIASKLLGLGFEGEVVQRLAKRLGQLAPNEANAVMESIRARTSLIMEASPFGDGVIATVVDALQKNDEPQARSIIIQARRRAALCESANTLGLRTEVDACLAQDDEAGVQAMLDHAALQATREREMCAFRERVQALPIERRLSVMPLLKELERHLSASPRSYRMARHALEQALRAI